MIHATPFHRRHHELFHKLLGDLEVADLQGFAMSCNKELLDLEVWLRYVKYICTL
jgi:hypothetical protein